MGFFRFFFLGQGPISSTHRLLTLFTALRHLAHFWTGTKLRYDEYGCDPLNNTSSCQALANNTAKTAKCSTSKRISGQSMNEMCHGRDLQVFFRFANRCPTRGS